MYRQWSSPRSSHRVSSTFAGGSPKRTGGWDSMPRAQSHRWRSRVKPGRAFACTTARPGDTSSRVHLADGAELRHRNGELLVDRLGGAERAQERRDRQFRRAGAPSPRPPAGRCADRLSAPRPPRTARRPRGTRSSCRRRPGRRACGRRRPWPAPSRPPVRPACHAPDAAARWVSSRRSGPTPGPSSRFLQVLAQRCPPRRYRSGTREPLHLLSARRGGQRAVSRSRSSIRRILPVRVFGRSSTNSILRG